MPSSSRVDRCANPFSVPGEKGHIGKDLRRISKAMLRTFSKLSCRKVCSACRKNYYKISKSNVSVHEDDNTENQEMNDSFIEDDTSQNTDNIEMRSVREIELEEFFASLKGKFLSLTKNDPLRLKILTLAPESWSATKISAEF